MGHPAGEGKGAMANVLPREKRLAVTAALVDGNSIRAVERMTGVHRDTIMRFGLALGEGCDRLHNRLVRDLSCSLVDMDEQWGWVKKKGPRVTAEDPADIGEQWTWVALDRSSRLAISYHVGRRDQVSANAFLADLRSRLVVMPQLMTSDGLSLYTPAIEAHMGPAATYVQTVKNYSAKPRRDDDHRYEPPRGIDFISKKSVFGAPNLDVASTALVERLNGTTRHFVGRMRRLSYAFSKTLAGHKAAMSLHYTHYNWCHVVRTLRVTPAMQAGLTDHVWELGEMMEALLTAAPCERPEKAPLEHRVPEGPARALPNGRGFLRLVGGGGAAPKGPGPSPAPTPTPALAAVPEAPPAEDRQLDLFAWKPRLPPVGTQLELFGEKDKR
jgi:IS1 family transposase